MLIPKSSKVFPLESRTWSTKILRRRILAKHKELHTSVVLTTQTLMLKLDHKILYGVIVFFNIEWNLPSRAIIIALSYWVGLGLQGKLHQAKTEWSYFGLFLSSRVRSTHLVSQGLAHVPSLSVIVLIWSCYIL